MGRTLNEIIRVRVVVVKNPRAAVRAWKSSVRGGVGCVGRDVAVAGITSVIRAFHHGSGIGDCGGRSGGGGGC